MTEAFVDNLATSRSLRKIDGTSPSLAPAAVSYQYPFQRPGKASTEIPADWSAADWSTYQGKVGDVEAALDELLEKVGPQVALYQRNGK